MYICDIKRHQTVKKGAYHSNLSGHARFEYSRNEVTQSYKSKVVNKEHHVNKIA